MSATNAWSYMCWLSGMMVGIGASKELWIMLIGGAILSVLSFYCLTRFGETP